jgi:hypothetical protein
MRIFLIASAAAFLIASPTQAATRNFGITSFEKIRVEGPFLVVLKTGVAPYAQASGSSAALDRVAIEVRGNTLVVHNDLNAWGSDSGRNLGPVQITLGTHDLSAATVAGSGSLTIDRAKGLSFDLSIAGSAIAQVGQADVDQLNLTLVGTASATLAGRAGKMTALVRGISALDTTNLAVKDAMLSADGTVKIKANVTNSVTVGAIGPATIELYGRPACTLRMNGSATVSGCRSTQ